MATNKHTGEVVPRPLEEGVVALIMAFPDYPPRVLLPEAFSDRHAKRAFTHIAVNPGTSIMPDHLEDGWTRFNPTDIERCVVKIALCEAIRVVDKKIRDPLLSRFILDGEGDSSEFLGAFAGHAITNDMHRVTHQKLIPRDENHPRGVMTTVELFSFLPSPSYQVVIRPPSGRIDFPA